MKVEISMKVTFYSNFLNHHQLPFCEEMVKKIGKDFTFIATEKLPPERIAMGYHDMSQVYDFAINTYDSDTNYIKALELSRISDVVIIGDAPDLYIEERLENNRLTFRYSERVFKKGYIHALDPRIIKSMITNHFKYRNKNLYMLCASAYTPSDMRLFHAYPNKMYKWGYFPEIIEYNIDDLFAKKKHEIIELLWVGRIINWKHTEKTIEVARRLKRDGYDFKLYIIGTGNKEKNIAELVNRYDLNENVFFLGSMHPEKVRKYMEKANIYLFTSDYQEGWGAVLNEAMNSGCAVVASHAIGSVPYLLKHGENGLVYKNGEDNDLYNQVKKLFNHPELCYELGRAAYDTLINVWNAEEATSRFIALSDALLKGSNISKTVDGPCSKAEVIMQKDMYRRVVEI